MTLLRDAQAALPWSILLADTALYADLDKHKVCSIFVHYENLDPDPHRANTLNARGQGCRLSNSCRRGPSICPPLKMLALVAVVGADQEVFLSLNHCHRACQGGTPLLVWSQSIRGVRSVCATGASGCRYSRVCDFLAGDGWEPRRKFIVRDRLRSVFSGDGIRAGCRHGRLNKTSMTLHLP